MKIVITDHAFPDLAIEEGIAAAAGATLVAAQSKDPIRLATAVADADAVITQFAPVNADVIAAMGRARVIVRYGIGVDNVDLAAARARGIPVCNIPDYCIDEVADHTLAFILALRAAGRVPHARRHDLRRGGIRPHRPRSRAAARGVRRPGARERSSRHA